MRPLDISGPIHIASACFRLNDHLEFQDASLLILHQSWARSRHWLFKSMRSSGNVPGVSTALLHRSERGPRHKTIALALVGTLVLALVAVLSVSSTLARKNTLLSLDDERVQAERIEAENRLLEEEESFLLRLAKERKVVPLARRRKSAVSKTERLALQNEKLKLQNERLQNELTMQRITALEDQSVEPLLTAEMPTFSSLATKQKNVKREMQQLVGSYVKTCTPWGCQVTYKPEEDDLNMTWYPGHSGNISWAGKGHTHLDVSTNMFSPLGPVRRQNITRYQTPWHDIVPKPSKLGDNWVGFGNGDSFVSVENSGLGIYPQLPPWKLGPMGGFNNYNYSWKPLHYLAGYTPNGSDPSAYKEVNTSKLRCPGDPTGRSCLSGGDGVDGVYESFPLSPVFYDPKKVLMEKHGVAVDSWPGVYAPEHHAWGRDAKDHYATPKDPEFFDYDSAARPYWAFDNHAMRSLPAYKDPEGVANKQLMLGKFWNDTHESFIDDDWVHNASYSLQLEVTGPVRAACFWG